MIKFIEEISSQTNIIDIIVFIVGSLTMGVWLLRTSLGTKALVNSPVRRNNMPPFLAIVPLLIWFASVTTLVYIKQETLSDLPDWQDALADNMILCVGLLPALILTIFIARSCFARRLKGFGLVPKTIARDFGMSILNLLAIMPVVLAIMVLTIIVGRFLIGPEFEMPRHEELQQILQYPQWQVRAMIMFNAILVVPTAEEFFFRGMLQTMLRSHISRPWPAIIFASIVFVVFHENPQHWPALFALSLCLGYSYEKSGSLFRPIFIHSFFNAMSVFAALWQ